MPGGFVEKLKSAWNAWKRIARIIGNFQARVLLTVIYVVAVLPFGLAARLFTDTLQLKKRPATWHEIPAETVDLQRAQRQ